MAYRGCGNRGVNENFIDRRQTRENQRLDLLRIMLQTRGKSATAQRRKNRESVQRGGINVRAVKIPSNGGERWTMARW